jgi:predicted CXXCH cytochrome family protein
VKGLLKKPVKEICLDCHDDLIAKKKVVHQPVDDGDCLACHNPHATNLKGLLKKPVPALCGDCHEDKDLKAVKAHAGNEDKSCVICHEAHASQDKFLLKAGAAAKEAGAAK